MIILIHDTVLICNTKIGEGVMVAAGVLVTKDIPAKKLAIGIPAKIAGKPEDLKVLNRI